MADSPTDAEAVAALLSMGKGSRAGGQINPSTHGAGARRLVRVGAAGVPGKVTEHARQGDRRPPAPLLGGHPGAAALAGGPLAAALPAGPAQRRQDLQHSDFEEWGQLQWPAQRRLRSRVPDRETTEAPAGLSDKRRKVS